MELYELQNHIIANTLPKFIVMYGTEYALINTYIEQIAKSTNLPIYKLGSCQQFIDKQNSLSLLQQNFVYVVKYEKEIVANEKQWTALTEIRSPDYLVLILDNIDKRSKFYKQLNKEYITEFMEQDANILSAMLTGQQNLNVKNLKRLMEGCAYNYGRCLLEIDKILSYAKLNKITHDSAYEALLKDGAIYEIPGAKLETFVDSVLCRKGKQCYSEYKELKEKRENNVVIIAWLYNAFRQQFVVESVKNATQENTGIKGFFIYKANERVGYYALTELRNALRVLKNTEQGLKKGIVDEAVMVEYALSQLL